MSRSDRPTRGVNGGRAWMHPALGHPMVWSVNVPERRGSWDSIAVRSLGEAMRLAAGRGLELTVHDETYRYMVEQGFAPATRPDGVLDDGPELHGFEALLATHRRAAGLLGLSLQEASALAHARGLAVLRMGPDGAVTAELRFDRVGLQTDAAGRVVRVEIG